jgi:putative DNA primase/helicase
MPDNIITVLKLRAMNRSVIPSGGGPTKKAPIVDWTIYQHELASIDQLVQWDNELNPTLWGIVTGAISGVVVFDTDAPEAFKVFDDAGLHPHIITKRGRHYYFKHPGKPVGNKAGIIPHLDFRGDGGFVNCLGSNENANYTIKIPPQNEYLYDMKQTPKIVQEAWIKGVTTPTKSNNIGETIVQSTRNQTLASLAGSMRRRGIPQSTIEIALIDSNKQLCKPPLSDREVLDIARSISRYKPAEEPKTKHQGGVEGL